LNEARRARRENVELRLRAATRWDAENGEHRDPNPKFRLCDLCGLCGSVVNSPLSLSPQRDAEGFDGLRLGA
jgi:hypothetical protein